MCKVVQVCVYRNYMKLLIRIVEVSTSIGLAGPQLDNDEPCERPQHEGHGEKGARGSRKLESSRNHLILIFFDA